MIKRSSIHLFCFLILPIFAFTQSNWLQKADHPDISGTAWGCSFTIGTKGYIIGAGSLSFPCGCLYEYDQSLDAWTQKANVPYQATIGPAAFVIGSKGYVCGGNQGVNWLFYEYDQGLNTWTQKANLPIEIEATVGFSIGNKGYVVAGQSNPNFTAAVWEYDTTFNSWYQKASFPGGPRAYAVGFSIGSKGYFGTGNGPGYSGSNDFWQFDPSANTWLQKANFPGLPRNSATGFSIGGKGYIGLGHDSVAGPAGLRNDFWEYDTITNTWLPIPDFATPREMSIGFTIGNKGYVVGGVDSSSTNWQSLRELWQYPDSVLSILPVLVSEKFTFFPNPTHEKLFITSSNEEILQAKIFDAIGKQLLTKTFQSNKEEINISSFASGIYFLQLQTPKGNTVKKFIKQ